MKKLFFLSAVMAAGLLTTGCSNDSDVVQNDDILSRFDANGKAYMSVQIMTHSGSPSTRANDVFVEGSAAEYAAKNAILVLFSGADEDNATFAGAYNLTPSVVSGTDTDVEKKYKAQISDENIDPGTNLYAFVVLNNNGQFKVMSGNGLTVTIADGTEIIVAPGATKFSTFKKYELDVLGNAEGTVGMLMTNAPLADKPNTKNSSFVAPTKVTTLAVVDRSKIYNSSSSADSNPGVTVYVERAAAKVQVYTTLGDSKVAITNEASTKYIPTEIKWIADVLEPTFYAVRNTSLSYLSYNSGNLGGGYNYRFVGANPEIAEGDVYRTYWGEDPHYAYTNHATAESGLTMAAVTDVTKGIASSLGTGDYQYIPENTMNEEGLTHDKTTRVVLAVKFNDGTGFYTLNRSDVVYPLSDAKNWVNNFTKDNSTYQSWLTTNSLTHDASKLDITLPTTAGDVTSGIEIAQTYDAGLTGFDAVVTAVRSALATSMPVTYYAGGWAYYQVRIRHFDDTEAPLATPVAGSTYGQLYGATPSAQNFLGRYGVVRNNWYNINVTSVKRIGSATIPEPDTTPDDEVDQYLTTQIYVTQWAQRTQNADLK